MCRGATSNTLSIGKQGGMSASSCTGNHVGRSCNQTLREKDGANSDPHLTPHPFRGVAGTGGYWLGIHPILHRFILLVSPDASSLASKYLLGLGLKAQCSPWSLPLFFPTHIALDTQNTSVVYHCPSDHP